jgi:hypothetical protein
MSASSGPSIQTDGLVFDYDMSNAQKSWRGKPATNTCSFGTYDYGYNSTKISNATPPIPPPITGYPIYKITSLDGNDSQQILYTATVDQVNGGTYTHSAYVYLESGTWVSAGQHWNPWDYGTQQFIPQGVWTRIEDPVTNSPSNYGNVAMCYNTNGAVYVTASQYELGSVASPFITQSNGVRSTAQAITDLTNNNTITTNSLTYASDGTFSFVRANSNYINISANTNTRFQNPYQTWSGWVNIVSTGPNGYSELWNNGGNTGMTIQWQTTGVTFFMYNSAYLGYTVTVSNALNTWMNITCVIDNVARVMILYKNGVLVGTSSQWNPYTPPNGSVHIGGNFATGNGGDFTQGTISNVQLYNRTLSAAEVQQNFNAQRTRYGI